MEMPHSRMFSAAIGSAETVFFDFIVQLRPHTRENVSNGSSSVTLHPFGQSERMENSGQSETPKQSGNSGQFHTSKRFESSGQSGESSIQPVPTKRAGGTRVLNTKKETIGQFTTMKQAEKRMEKRLEKTSRKTGREIAYVLRLRAAQWEDLGLWTEYVNRMILDVIFLNSGLFFLVMEELRSASIRNDLLVDNQLEVRAILSKRLDTIVKNQVYETLMEYVRSPELTIQTFFSLYITRVLEAVQPEEMAKFLTFYLHVLRVPTALKITIATGS